jgi:mannose-1-phosphate guanylyltransferase
VRAAFAWSDVGSWSDLHDARVEAGEADRDGNVVDGDVLTVGARGSTVVARGNRLVAVVGADSLVVVDTPDALLVVPSDRAQLVKDAVERLRDRGRSDVL